MYCKECGKEMPNEAVICTGCGCMLKSTNTASTPAPQVEPKKSNASIVLGILGIIFAWLIALVGHIVSIIGIVLGIKEYKATGKMTGLILSIIGEVCAIFSSIIGAVTVSSLF